MTQTPLPFTTQRWRERRDSYRPAGETIQTAAYDVAAIAEDRVARAFVATHHYSGTYPAARARFGLYHHGILVGVAVYSHPCSDAVLTRVFPGRATESVELGRFVLLDEVPGNGETWFLARTFEHLRHDGLRGVVSFSDPVPRTTADGRALFPGHIGTIYQAANAQYLGRGAGGLLHLLPDGTVLSRRAIQKIRTDATRGWRYSARALERHGAPKAPADLDARLDWLVTWLPRLTRPLRHPGNHKYAWPLTRPERRRMPVSTLPYPKRDRSAPLTWKERE